MSLVIRCPFILLLAFAACAPSERSLPDRGDFAQYAWIDQYMVKDTAQPMPLHDTYVLVCDQGPDHVLHDGIAYDRPALTKLCVLLYRTSASRGHSALFEMQFVSDITMGYIMDVSRIIVDATRTVHHIPKSVHCFLHVSIKSIQEASTGRSGTNERPMVLLLQRDGSLILDARQLTPEELATALEPYSGRTVQLQADSLATVAMLHRVLQVAITKNVKVVLK